MPDTKQPWLWGRLFILGITGMALYLVFRRLNLDTLAETFRGMQWGWFVGAVALYGALFIPAAWRWHIVLRLTGQPVHPAAATRLTLIGHFFYTALLGVFGGDTAKSVVYARWYRLPLAQVLAAAPLDRLLGFFGLLLFSAAALGEAGLAGAFTRVKSVSLQWPRAWMLIVIVIALAFFFIAGRWLGPVSSAWQRFTRALAHGAKVLARSPRTAASGVFCGMLVQMALSGVLALNLRAASHAPLAWGQLLWTFPVVVAISGLPLTFAGLGAREGAALALFGIYGVTHENAVGASLLTVATSLSWALVGGLLYWRERRWQRHQQPLPKTISVVIPTLNEAASLKEVIERVRRVPEVCEIIVSDGGSRDETCEIATGLGCRVLRGAAGRGGQMRRGAAEAKGDVVLLLHADTWVPPEAGRAMLNCLRDASVSGGGFWKVFRERNPWLLGSRLKCAIRLYLGRRIMGDQAMFARREVLKEIGGVPDMPLMEEFELCRRLRKVGRLALADAVVITSARRFKKLGVVRTYLRMWRVTLSYWFGMKPQELRRIYEKE
jgi:rSAM/selenodomain-associated transferase 2